MQNLSSTTSGGKTKYKMVLLGDCGVGKSSIIEKYIHGSFDSAMQSTVGIDFLAKNLQHKGKTYRLQLWDTAGQQRFKSLIPSYLKQACVSIIVFDVTKKLSLLHSKDWLTLFSKHKNIEGYSILVGNKVDLSYRQVTKEEGQRMAKDLNLGYFEVSAKTNENIDQLFQHLIEQLEVGKINGIPLGTILDQVDQEQEQKEQQSRNQSKPKIESVEQTEAKIITPSNNGNLFQPNIILNTRQISQQPVVNQRGCCS